ncbi:hypothetical protein T484DRAFT_1850340, partial [Baffinella frigidus]
MGELVAMDWEDSGGEWGAGAAESRSWSGDGGGQCAGQSTGGILHRWPEAKDMASSRGQLAEAQRRREAAGGGALTDVEALAELMRECGGLGEEEVAHVLGLMCRKLTGLPARQPFRPRAGPRAARTGEAAVLVKTVKEAAPELDWERVALLLDPSGLDERDSEELSFLEDGGADLARALELARACGGVGAMLSALAGRGDQTLRVDLALAASREGDISLPPWLRGALGRAAAHGGSPGECTGVADAVALACVRVLRERVYKTRGCAGRGAAPPRKDAEAVLTALRARDWGAAAPHLAREWRFLVAESTGRLRGGSPVNGTGVPG